MNANKSKIKEHNRLKLAWLFKLLQAKGWVALDPHKRITLTKEGLKALLHSTQKKQGKASFNSKEVILQVCIPVAIAISDYATQTPYI